MVREDFGTEQLSDCSLQYYYFIPRPSYSWFWAFVGWTAGDVLGQCFTIGDPSMGGAAACDPGQCHTLEQIRVLDFAGYGAIHRGLFTFEIDVYRADTYACPVVPSLWNSGPPETDYSWNYFDVDPSLSICPCVTDPGPPPSAPRILVTVRLTGTEWYFPAWGFDNIGWPVEYGCIMHDSGCLPYTPDLI